MKAIIIAVGKGSRLWPFTEIRSKSMLAVSNIPIISWSRQALSSCGVLEVSVLVDNHESQLVNFSRKSSQFPMPSIHVFPGEKDIVDVLLSYQLRHPISETVLIIPGDCIIQAEDLQRLIDSPEENAVLLRGLRQEERSDRLCFNAKQGFKLLAHPRREGFDYEIVAYKLGAKFFNEILPYTTNIYDYVQVGMMPSDEKYLESALVEWEKKVNVDYVFAEKPCFNIDYPWNILEANDYLNELRCQRVAKDEISRTAAISPTAILRGNVQIGANSLVGDGVIFQGNAIVGTNCKITDGAIIGENAVIGDNVIIKEYCKVSSGSTVGDGSIIGHCAELSGIIFENTYLYHNCEISGVLGRNVDIGAGTVFGTLRFDDAKVNHRINGKRITPQKYSELVYMGDFTRTGVNTVIMPGVKVGCRSVVGANVLLNEDLPNNKIIQVEQNVSIKPWGSERYGFNM